MESNWVQLLKCFPVILSYMYFIRESHSSKSKDVMLEYNSQYSSESLKVLVVKCT